jgi:hypothetical protein
MNRMMLQNVVAMSEYVLGSVGRCYLSLRPFAFARDSLPNNSTCGNVGIAYWMEV